MKRNWRMAISLILTLSITTPVWASLSSYLTESEYNDILTDNYKEDRGIVVENEPELGYLTYKNINGELITRQYYAAEISVEKQPYYEVEDKIGYLDELFPVFSYDPRDVEITSIQNGDCIYIRTNADGYITYLSAYNDYAMRYGKVVSFQYNTGETATLQMEDDKGNLYYYEVGLTTPVTKGSKLVTLSTIQPGDYVKVLVSQKILGQGIIDEVVLEVVIDHDNRQISNIYRGQLTSIDTIKNALNIKNAQLLGKLAWGSTQGVMSLSVDPKSVQAYLIGNRISVDYMKRYMVNADGYMYVAAENYKGKEQAVKLNFQSKLQTTLAPSPIIATTLTSVKLLSGETLYISEDAILVRDNRLITAGSLVVGETLQAVVTGENKLAVGVVSSGQTTGSLQVYRGRIKKITERESFQVETFSLLEGNTWYYHPTPQTFTIHTNTRFYNESGLITGGVEQFLGYGDQSSIGDVYTIVAVGNEAYAIVDMPYTTESVKGTVYAVADGAIQIKDAYYYHRTQKSWKQYSSKNVGGTINITPQTVIIKNGKVIPSRQLEVGDTIQAMLQTNFKDAAGTVDGYIIIVEN